MPCDVCHVASGKVSGQFDRESSEKVEYIKRNPKSQQNHVHDDLICQQPAEKEESLSKYLKQKMAYGILLA